MEKIRESRCPQVLVINQDESFSVSGDSDLEVSDSELMDDDDLPLAVYDQIDLSSQLKHKGKVWFLDFKTLFILNLYLPNIQIVISTKVIFTLLLNLKIQNKFVTGNKVYLRCDLNLNAFWTFLFVSYTELH